MHSNLLRDVPYSPALPNPGVVVVVERGREWQAAEETSGERMERLVEMSVAESEVERSGMKESDDERRGLEKEMAVVGVDERQQVEESEVGVEERQQVEVTAAVIERVVAAA